MRPGVNQNIQGDYHYRVRELDADDMRIMHLPPEFWGVGLDDLHPGTRAHEVVSKFLKDVPTDMKEVDPTVFFFTGPAESGKTSAAALMARAARSHRFTVFFLDITLWAKAIIDDRITEDSDQTYAERAFSTDLLVIDSLGAENTRNEFARSELTGLIRHRQSHLKKTIITTSMTGEELDKGYGKTFSRLIIRRGVVVETLNLEGD